MLQERSEDEQAPQAEDDAGDRREQLDSHSHRPPHPRRSELRQEHGDAEADRNRQQHREGRGDQRAVDGCESPEFLGNRIPDGLREESDFELGERGPGAHEEGDGDAAEQRQDQNCGDERGSAEELLSLTLNRSVPRFSRSGYLYCHVTASPKFSRGFGALARIPVHVV